MLEWIEGLSSARSIDPGRSRVSTPAVGAGAGTATADEHTGPRRAEKGPRAWSRGRIADIIVACMSSPAEPRSSPAGRLALATLGVAVAGLAWMAARTWVLDPRVDSRTVDEEVRRWAQHPTFFAERDGRWVARHPNMPPVTFAATKPASTLRVFVLGGSQAMGDPYVHARRALDGHDLGELGLTNTGGIATWLERYLQRLYPQREIEVVNAAMGNESLTTAAGAYEEIARTGDPDLVIILAGNNEVFQASPGSRSEFERLLARATARFGEQLDRIVAVAEERSTPTYVLTVPTNVRDWLPSYAHQPVAKDSIDRLLDDASDPAPQQRTQVLERLADADHALHDYLVARDDDRGGRHHAALRGYVQAKDRDFNLIRAHSSWNDLVRATSSPEVTAFDLEAALGRQAADGIPGYDLFHDHCHMKLRANMLAAREIAAFHQRHAGLDAVELPELDVSEHLADTLDRLYAIKEGKWRRIRELEEFDALGDRNRVAVQAQFEQARRDLAEVIERSVERYESERDEASP